MRPSRQLVTAANQQITHEFWDDHRARFRLFVSLAVINEAMAGDTQAASERAEFLQGLPILEVTEEVEELANEIALELSLPSKASVDAVHIAAATLNGLDYLLTWNCKHIANPQLRHRIERVCENTGYVAPVICTPPELIEVTGP
jgi:predicted nucleic acid-binding protein